MSDQLRFIWLEGIFDEATVHSFPAHSPASNLWQQGFVSALQKAGHVVEVFGYPAERIWPYGRLLVGGGCASLSPDLHGKVAGYFNFPFLRGTSQYVSLLATVKRYLHGAKQYPDYQIVYSCINNPTELTPAFRAAKRIRERFGIPIVCIVADGATPAGADAYVYLAWSGYQAHLEAGPSIHLDGGIPEVKGALEPRGEGTSARQKILMYMGALTEHGGVTQLARAFNKLPDDDIQLWICGRGSNAGLAQLAATDQRIKLLGFVEERELGRLASAAFAFANPRANSFAPNKLNYPSKLLHYLAYGKPIVSSITDGVSPDYRDVLVQIADDSEASLGEAIQRAFNLSEVEYSDLLARVARFNESRAWTHQIGRFTSWLSAEASR